MFQHWMAVELGVCISVLSIDVAAGIGTVVSPAGTWYRSVYMYVCVYLGSVTPEQMSMLYTDNGHISRFRRGLLGNNERST